MPSTTVGRALVSATQRLDDGGSSTPHLDAQVILAHVLGTDRSWLFAHHEYKLTPAEADVYTELIARRAASEPVAYIVGRREFYELDLAVDRRVLIPRPETEMLVEIALNEIRDLTVAASLDVSPGNSAVRIADIGTGSGAIALAIAANCPAARIDAVDISREALEVARSNVDRLDTRRQVTLLEGDLLRPVSEAVDIIVANLPYVTAEEYPHLMPDVRDYEPKLALVGGPQGLDAVHRLLIQAPGYLRPHGKVLLEIGCEQAAAVVQLAHELIPQATYVGVRQDYHGLDRVVLISL